MKYCTTQCRQCPFRPTSARGWLGSYRAADVFHELWHGQPFFCHSKINYARPDWLARALRSGRLCLGGLVAANRWHCPTPTDDTIRQARADVGDRDDVETMGAREFIDYHGPHQSYLVELTHER